MPPPVRRRLAVAACLAWAVAGCSPGATFVSTGEGTAVTPEETSTPGLYLQRLHATYLRPGDCLWELPHDLVATLVSCEMPHAAEYASIYVLPEGPWPGEAAARRGALDWCGPRLRVRESRRDDVKAGVLLPLEHEWPAQRTAYCLAVPREGELVGRVLK
ncbi:hypothetical protein [Nonomuraea indica]|uniref:Septum formation-related domain-containing protein n=1 Tax=Nonomuraea indica TaxID=1581193 RepID=A0ABW8AAN9_9ACTN